MLKLFYTPGACSMVPHIVLEEIGIPFESKSIDFSKSEQLSAEYLKINPKARVPALATDRGVLTEIPAILGYLVRTYPEAGLAPGDDPFAFADMQAFHMYIATTIHVLFRQISRPETFADGTDAKAALKTKVPEMSDKYFALMEERMSDGRPYVHGDKYSASDPYLAVFANYLKMGDRGNPKKIPYIWAHHERVWQRPAVQKVLATEGLPDFFAR